MKIKMLVFGCLVLGGNVLYAMASEQVTLGGKTYRGELLNTTGNRVGIQDDAWCVYDPFANVIACSSGTLFANPVQKESALTGTPGRLMYDNYIGTLRKSSSMPGRMGSGKRIDFCVNE